MPLNSMEKFLENLYEAEKSINKIDHILYVTYPLVRDKRLILKTLVETKFAIARIINSILQYDYLFKRIRLYRSPKQNFKLFVDKCAPRYNITPLEIKLIIELFDIVEKHKNSPFEFRKDEKIVILTEDSQPKVIVLDNTKQFLSVAKQILEKTKNMISN